jgi:hypothetical protein
LYSGEVEMADTTTTTEVPLRLTASRADAVRDIQAQVKIGQAIRDQRVKDQRDLDEARQEKQEWVQRTTDVLARLFNTGVVCDHFNDWVATILPEYAELEMFVELYDDEMRHRLARLAAILKNIREVPEPATIGGQEMPATTETIVTNTLIDTAIGATVEAAPPMPSRSRKSSIFAQSEKAAAEKAAQPAPAPTIIEKAAPARQATRGSSGLLIVRANDDGARDSVAQFVQKLGLKVQALDRTAPAGRSLLDDIAATQAQADFILLLTGASDHQNLDGDSLFDLGCCVGRFGAARIIVLHRGGEGQVDRFGLSHVVVDQSDGWQLQLARHLRKGGVDVDLNRLV